MEIANASLLDESTAAAESMWMFFMRSVQVKSNVNKFFVSNDLYLQTVDVITARAEPLGIEIIFGDANSVELTTNSLVRLYNIQMLTVKFMTTVSLLLLLKI